MIEESISKSGVSIKCWVIPSLPACTVVRPIFLRSEQDEQKPPVELRTSRPAGRRLRLPFECLWVEREGRLPHRSRKPAGAIPIPSTLVPQIPNRELCSGEGEDWETNESGKRERYRCSSFGSTAPGDVNIVPFFAFAIVSDFSSVLMETNADSKTALPESENEAPTESTVEIKIKTLDSQTYTLRVDKYVPVPALKEQIANVTGVLSEQQRLICQGKVLKDDQLLSAYHVEDGHTLHLVVRQPIGSQQTDASSSSRSNLVGGESRPTISENSQLRGPHVGHNILFGTVSLADQGDTSASDLSRIVSTVISSLGGNNADGRGVSLSSRERPLHIHAMASGTSEPSNNSQPPEQESRSNQFGHHPGTTQLPASASLGNHQPHHQPTVIPDSLTTLSQYIAHMKTEFDELCSSFQSGNVREEHPFASVSNNGASRGLPTADSLADIMFLGRQLLIDQAGGCLYELASQLQGQAGVTDTQTRANIQSNALRSGVLFQNLGSLLLELGRAIMTLRMGQTSEEAVVNAGPAIFVSASGPNPIMVQAGTGFNSMSTIPTQGRAPTFGSGLLSRNIDIRIRRGPMLHAASVNEAGQASRPQPSDRADVASNSVDNFVHQILQGTANGAPGAGESSVRVVPIRTVFAIPAGIAHPSSDAFANSDALTHPLFSRLREQLQGNQNIGNSSSTDVLPNGLDHYRVPNEPDLRPASVSRTGLNPRDENPSTTSMHVPAEESIPNQGSIIFSSLDTQGLTDDGNNDTGEAHGRMHNVNPLTQVFEALRSIFPGEQVHENEGEQHTTQGQGPSSQEISDGIFFSNLLHQVMPFISQHATSQPDAVLPNSNPSLEQDQRQTEPEDESRRDTSEEPVSKRQRM